MRLIALSLVATALTACGTPSNDATDNAQVDLRNLVEGDEARARPDGLAVQGDLIPTPSDTASRYYLLRTRDSVAGPNVSIVRQERGERVVYARVLTDCAARKLLVVGTGETRGEVETDVATRAPLRDIAGLPLRQDMARYICDRAGTPLAAE